MIHIKKLVISNKFLIVALLSIFLVRGFILDSYYTSESNASFYKISRIGFVNKNYLGIRLPMTSMYLTEPNRNSLKDGDVILIRNNLNIFSNRIGIIISHNRNSVYMQLKDMDGKIEQKEISINEVVGKVI